jgi:hypothetical protein
LQIGEADQFELLRRSQESEQRVSLLDETFVVKHINESAIYKDHESFSLADSFLGANMLRGLQQNEDVMMFDASKLDYTIQTRPGSILQTTQEQVVLDQTLVNGASI